MLIYNLKELIIRVKQFLPEKLMEGNGEAWQLYITIQSNSILRGLFRED